MVEGRKSKVESRRAYVVTSSDRAPYLARWPLWLAVAIVLWGALIAAGAYWRYRDLKKASVILITAAVFALVWVAVARGRKK